MQMRGTRGDGSFGGEFFAFGLVDFVAGRTENRTRRVGFEIDGGFRTAARADDRDAGAPASTATVATVALRFCVDLADVTGFSGVGGNAGVAVCKRGGCSASIADRCLRGGLMALAVGFGLALFGAVAFAATTAAA